MIDVHCHILPGIDDGARRLEDSLQMLRQAEAAGITDIILTPHYIKGSTYNANNVKKWQLFQELKTEAKKQGIKPRLYLGNEIYIDEKMSDLVAGYAKEKSDLMYEISTLNSTKYILVEFPVQFEDRTAKDSLFKLIQKGFTPVIAHPERYFYVQHNPDYVDQFLAMGCLFQGDYLALLGKYGKLAEKTLKTLIQHDKIFCLASDLHKPDDYRLPATHKKLLKIVKSEQKIADLFVNNPQKILRGTA